MRTLDWLLRLMRSIHWHLCDKFPRLMTRPNWFLLQVEIKWMLKAKRFRPKLDEGELDPFEWMGESETVGTEIP